MTLEQMKSRMMFAEKVAENARRIWEDSFGAALDWADENLRDHPDFFNPDAKDPTTIHASTVTQYEYDRMYETLDLFHAAKAEYETAARMGELV